jgi:uncharacterized protein YkwD
MALTLPASAHAESCPDADLPLAAGTEQRVEAAVGCLVNAERTSRGLAALSFDARLAQAADWHAQDMRDRGFFAHDAPAPAPHGTNAGARIEAAGYEWTTWGENIASGFDTAHDVMEAWMRSEGHCRNILSPRLAQLGVGVAPGDGPEWVQAFGTPSAGGARLRSSGPATIDLGAACPAPGLGAGTPMTTPASAPAPRSGVASGSSTGGPSAVRPRIRFKARQVGRRINVEGRVSGAVRRVRITLRRGRGQRVVLTPVRAGRFRVAMVPPSGSGLTRVVVATL